MGITSRQGPGQSMLLLYKVESDIPCLHVLQELQGKRKPMKDYCFITWLSIALLYIIENPKLNFLKISTLIPVQQ
jgi:hypothetical protein